jgi:hypothetical protein
MVLRSGPWILVYIELRNLYPAGIFACQLIDDRRQIFAVAAPWRPEIDEHRPRISDDLLLEARIGYIDRPGSGRSGGRYQGLVAPSTPCLATHPVQRNPVLRPAVRAENDEIFLVHIDRPLILQILFPALTSLLY